MTKSSSSEDIDQKITLRHEQIQLTNGIEIWRFLVRLQNKKATQTVEKATFTPAVFLTTGGMSKECKRFVNRVADLIAGKRKERYCDVVRHVRTRIRFAMLRTTLIALWGYRGKNGQQI